MSRLADRLLGRTSAPAPRPENAAASAAAEGPAGTPSRTSGSLAVKLLEARHGPGFRPAPNSRVAGLLWGDGPRETPELRRILALPKKGVGASDTTVEFLHTAKCRGGCMLCRPRVGAAACSPGCARCAAGEAHLWPIQSEALYWARHADGLLAPIGVGFGKTLVSLLLPLAMNSKRAVLLVPPQMRDQLRGMIRTISRHWRLPETIVFGSDGNGPLRVFGYSEISVARGATALEDADPDLVICDEAHMLRHRQAARTRRFLRLFRNKPGVRLAALSGTITTRSLKDYAHLSELALHKNSPLPKPWPELDDWCRALDADAHVEFGRRLPIGALAKLAGGATDLESVRAGFRERLTSTPGVVATSEGALGTSLAIRIADPGPQASIDGALGRLRATWAVGGEEIQDAMRLAAVERQVALGFHYVWDWPGGVIDEEWLAARAAWHREIREKLSRNPPAGMDSPLFLANAAAAGRWVSAAWPAWAAVKGRSEPPAVPVWIDEGFAPAVAKAWLDEGDGKGVIWYEHRAIGDLVAGRLGLPRFGGGDDAALLAASPATHPAIVCSIKAHGTLGKELQAWDRALVLGAPANGTAWEQLLGRLHRPGQEADEVEFTLLESARGALDKAIEDARYEEATVGGRQKLLYARIEEV